MCTGGRAGRLGQRFTLRPDSHLLCIRYLLTVCPVLLAHLAVPYGGRQDARLETKYIQQYMKEAVQYSHHTNVNPTSHMSEDWPALWQ
jgi:hypothetical protein